MLADGRCIMYRGDFVLAQSAWLHGVRSKTRLLATNTIQCKKQIAMQQSFCIYGQRQSV